MSADDSPRDLVVVVPVYGNADTLAETARRVIMALEPLAIDFRLLFVVDASPDDSWSVVQILERQEPRVAGILLPVNVGQHKAILQGLRHLPAHYYAVIDADLQDPPEVLPQLLAHARPDGRTVFACRRGAYQSLGRMASSRVFKTLVSLWIGLPASAGSYLLMPGTVARRLTAMALPVAHVPSMAWLCSERTGTIGYHRPCREQGRSAYSGWRRLKAAGNVVRCIWAVRRAAPDAPAIEPIRPRSDSYSGGSGFSK